MDHLYSKKYRLLSKSDFENLRSDNHFFSSDHLLFFVKKNNLSNSRLGIAVSKKYGNACKRNRVKRLVRECFRQSPAKADGLDILVVPNIKKIKQKKITYEEFESKLDTSFSKALSIHFNI